MVRAGPAAQATPLRRKSTKERWTNLERKGLRVSAKMPLRVPANWSGCGGVSPVFWTENHYNYTSDGPVSPAEECELRELVANRIHTNEENLPDEHGSNTTSGSLTKCTCALSPSRQGWESEQSTSGHGRKSEYRPPGGEEVPGGAVKRASGSGQDSFLHISP